MHTVFYLSTQKNDVLHVSRMLPKYRRMMDVRKFEQKCLIDTVFSIYPLRKTIFVLFPEVCLS